MQINFPTRDKARSFAQKRTANGFNSKVVDNGKEVVKRFAVDLKGVHTKFRNQLLNADARVESMCKEFNIK